MNIAFSALVILFLALPGICLIVAYRSERGRPVGGTSMTDEIPTGAALSLLLHFAWVVLFDQIGSFLSAPKQVALGKALTLLASPASKDGGLAPGLEKCLFEGDHGFYVVVYEVSICAFAFCAGVAVKRVVTHFGIDRRSKFFRWNDWFYLLRGESPEQKAAAGEYDTIAISAVVGDHLYLGYLYDFFVNRQGELDTIVLSLPQRRKLGEGEDGTDGARGVDTTGHPAYYKIAVDYLVLKYAEISNLGITGIGITDDETEVVDPTPPAPPAAPIQPPSEFID